MTSKLCPDLDCINPESTLIKELDKELCPKPKKPKPYICSQVIVAVSSNIQSLQYKKRYEKVCHGRHKVDAKEIYHKSKTIPESFAHLCPPCK